MRHISIMTNDANISIDDLRLKVADEIRHHRGWHLLESMLFITAGLLAVMLPMATGLAINGLMGVLLVIAGCVRISNGMSFSRGREWRMVSGLVFAAAGGAMLMWPVLGMAALSMVLGALLVLEGIADILIALAYRPAYRWGALLFSGILSLTLGFFIFSGFPLSGMIVLAVIVGISMAFYGLSLLLLTLRIGADAD